MSKPTRRTLVALFASLAACTVIARAETEKPKGDGKPKVVAEFFNGKDLTGWDGDATVWSVDKGEFVGKSEKGLKTNNFIKSKIPVSDFRLTFQIKLVPNDANSGVQFRSVPIEGGEMRGPQADIGEKYWGKLYEESARGLLSTKDCLPFVKQGDWNLYEIVAVGSKVRTAINGNLCVDLDDPKLAKEGLLALQVHSGMPTEVRFKDLVLEANPEFVLKTLKAAK